MTDDRGPGDDFLRKLAEGMFFAILAGGLTGGGAAAIRLTDSLTVIVIIGAVALTITFRLSVGGFTRDQPLRNRRLGFFGRFGFYAWRDADVAGRNDEGSYDMYRELRAEASSLWRRGQLVAFDKFKQAKDNVLNTIINVEARRLEHVCRGPVTLALVEDTGERFIAKRTSEGRLGIRIAQGMSCLHNNRPLDTTLDHYAQYHRKVKFFVCGQMYYLVALSNEVDFEGATARSILSGATNEYENAYQLFRWMAVSSPPPRVLPGSDGELG